MRRLFLASIFALIASCVAAQPALPPPSVSIANQLASITADFRTNNTIAPGVIIKVYNPNNWEWSYANGISSIANNTPATPGLVFRAASLSKLFCTTAILKLASQGTLHLSDNISLWLPASYVAQIENNSQITIRTLLNHTSSLDEPQFGTSLANNFLGDPDINYRDSILQIIANQFGNPNGVGSFFYSNANFNLLAEIVKNASGMPYKNYLTQKIIQPLNLSNTYLDTLPVANGFNGYVPCNSLPNCTLPNPATLLDYSQANVGWGYGSADVSSTAGDLIKFYYNLQNGQIIPQNWVDSMTSNTVDAANSFSNKRYGLGTMQFQRNGTTYAIGHTGTAASHANILCQLKPSNIYVCFSFNIIRCNREAFLDLIERYLQTVTTVVNLQKEDPFKFYPNPSRNNLNIDLNKPDNVDLEIANGMGQIVYRQKLNAQHTEINIAKLPGGLYFLSCKGPATEKTTRKVLIQNGNQ